MPCHRTGVLATILVMLSALGLSLGVSLAQEGEPVPPPPLPWPAEYANLALSEVQPLPLKEEDPTWVELRNFGEEPVSIAGWSLADQSGTRYVFPAGLPPVPPEGIVLVVFPGPQSPPEDDLSFEGDGCARLYSRNPDAASAFRGPVNECALYVGPEPKPEHLLDYLCWGEWRPTPNAEAAHRVGLWPRRFVHLLTGPGPFGPNLLLEPGGSCGRPYLSSPRYSETLQMMRPGHRVGDWDAYAPPYVSPGQRNGYPPITHIYGPRGKEVPIGPTGFGYAWPASLCHAPDKDRWRDHLQVSAVPDFSRLLVDALIDPQPYACDLPPGRYYWRIRLESPEAATPWSEVIEFELLPPPG